jgi:hypothetical protein
MLDRNDKKKSSEKIQSKASRPCPCCGGTGKVAGVVDDIEFEFACTCSGGNEEALRWLLGTRKRPGRRKRK